MIKRTYFTTIYSCLLIANLYSSLPRPVDQALDTSKPGLTRNEPGSLFDESTINKINKFDRTFVNSQPFAIDGKNGFRRLVKNYFREKNLPLPIFRTKANVIDGLLNNFQMTNTDIKKINNIAYCLLYNDNEDIAYIIFDHLIKAYDHSADKSNIRLAKKIQRTRDGLTKIISGDIRKPKISPKKRTPGKTEIYKIQHKFYPQYNIKIPFIQSNSRDAQYTKYFLVEIKKHFNKEFGYTRDVFAFIRKDIRKSKKPNFRNHIRVANCLSHITKEQLSKVLKDETFDYQELTFVNLQRTAKCIYQIIIDSKKATIDNKFMARLNLLQISNNETEQNILIKKLRKTSKGEPKLAIRLANYFAKSSMKDNAIEVASEVINNFTKRNKLDKAQLTSAVKALLLLSKYNDEYPMEEKINEFIKKAENNGFYIIPKMYLQRENFQLMDSIVTAYYFIMQGKINNATYNQEIKDIAQTILLLTNKKPQNRFREKATKLIKENENIIKINEPQPSSSNNNSIISKRRYGNKGYHNKKQSIQKRRARSLSPAPRRR